MAAAFGHAESARPWAIAIQTASSTTCLRLPLPLQISFSLGRLTEPSASFGPYTVSWNTAPGQYFARYDTNGNPQLATSFGSPTTRPHVITARTNGDVYVAGDFDGLSFFGTNLIAADRNGAVAPLGFGDAFVAKFDRNGNPFWAREATAEMPIYYGTNGYVNLRGLALTPDGVWASGFGQGEIHFGSFNEVSDIQYIPEGIIGDLLIWRNGGEFGKITETGSIPYITQQPMGRTNECGSGADAVLTVAVSNAPPLYYQWYVGTNLLAAATNATLDVSSANFSDSGQYYVTILNSFGAVTSDVASVLVQDTLPPQIYLNGQPLIITVCPSTYVERGAVAYDECAGQVPVTTNGAVSFVAPSTNFIYYGAKDPSCNSSTYTRTFIVLPVTNPPTISLRGADPMQVVTGSVFTDPGASAVDQCTNPVSVVVSGSVNPEQNGVYTLSYTATDSHGLSSTNTRSVIVESALACVPPPSAEIGWWTGNGNADDLFGAHPGTIEGGVTFASGLIGEAFSFDGVNGYVDLGTFSPGTAWSIDAWVNLASAQPDLQVIAGVNGYCSSWALAVSNAQFAIISERPGDCVQTTFDQFPATVGAWHHVAATCDGTNATLYVDGIETNKAPVQPNYPADNVDVRIGASTSGGEFFAGLIEQVGIYARALSPAEVGDLANAGDAGKCLLTPEILAFAPDEGQPGNVFYLAGTNFYAVTNVTIGGLSATHVVVSPTEIAVAVPVSATTGPITVQTLNGAATTSSNFVVGVQHSCLPSPGGQVAWWAAQGTALDAYGHQGIVQGGVSYAQGEVGEGFQFDGATGSIAVPANSSIDAGQGGSLSVEGWINPTSVANQQPIVEWGPVYFGEIELRISAPANAGGNGPGCLFAKLRGTDGEQFTLASAPGVITAGTLQHVALTYDNASGIGTLYVNGEVVQQSIIGQVTPQTSDNFYIGYSPAQSLYWGGVLDEISLYNRALSPTEVASIYDVGTIGKCPIPAQVITSPTNVDINETFAAAFSVHAIGTPPLSYAWLKNNAALSNSGSHSRRHHDHPRYLGRYQRR